MLDTAPRSVDHRVRAASVVGFTRSAMALVLSVVVARFFGMAARGDLAFLQALVASIYLVGDLGVGTAVRRFATDSADKRYLSAFLGLAVGLVPGLALISGALYWLTAPDESIGSVTILAAMTLAVGAGITRFNTALLNAIGSFFMSQIVQLVETMMHLLGIALIYMVFGPSTESAAVGLAMGSLFGAIGSWLLSNSQRPKIRLDRNAGLELLGFGARTVPATASVGLLNRVDQLIVGAVGGSAVLGQYAVAASIAEALRPRAQAASQFAFRLVAKGGSNINKVKNLLRRSLKTQLLGSPLLCAAGVWLAAPIFGADFGGIGVTVGVLIAGELAFVGYVFGTRTLLGLGEPKSAAGVGLIALAVGAGLDLLLIEPFGIVGAATASLSSYVVACVLGFGLVRRGVGSAWA